GGAYRPVRITGGCTTCGEADVTFVRDHAGRVVRKQGADGYITVTTYGANGSSERPFLRPSGCDPATDSQRCRMTPDALATVTLIPTNATSTVSYEYGDPLWPDLVTGIVTPSVYAPGQFRRESRTYHPSTGAVISSIVSGWSVGGSAPVLVERSTRTSHYGDPCDAADTVCGTAGPLAPVFDPGGAFETPWLALTQPAGLRKREDGARLDVQDVTAFVYYPIDPSVPALLRGRLAAARNAAGHVTHYEAYDLFGQLTRTVDANGVVTEFQYDGMGRLTASIVKGMPGCDTNADPLCATDLESAFAYLETGPLQMEQRPGGGVIAHTYDDRGRLRTRSRGPAVTDLRERIEYSYDPLIGAKSRERILAHDGSTWVEASRVSYAYDTNGRLETVTHADGATTGYTYDESGRVNGFRNENHATPNTRYTYDPAGRLTAVAQTLSTAGSGEVVTRYAYDAHGNLVAVTDPNGNVTSYVYDDFGQMLEQVSPVTGSTTYQYDAAGQLLTTTLVDSIAGDGRDTTSTTTRAYDALGRVLSSSSVLSGQSESVSWSYDTGAFGKGRLASMTDPTGTTTYAYDRRGLLLSETRTIGSAVYATRYGYDANGNRSRIVYPSGRIVDYAFDYASRPMSAVAGATTLVTSASYLPFGPMSEIVFGNGTTRTTAYDPRYRPLTNTLTGPLLSGEDEPTTGVIASYEYTHDPAGNITRIADLVDPSYDRDFGYDDLHRLTTANGGEGLWGAGSYVYDAMGNLRSTAVGTNLHTFTMTGTTPKIASVM
ncbi:hypothetical protein L0Y59_04760, partial [Candidatus Uhrbacteria bacterium]|nr:hypothetical protein [Candidatus Uhrbacteria bacterium]